MYTLIGTAKTLRPGSASLLQYVLEHIADHPINKIEESLPWSVVSKPSPLRLVG
jgi:hypothetical protein